MPYDPDTSWSYWAREAEINAGECVERLNRWLEKYNDWQVFRDGRTNAQIASDLGRAEADVQDLDNLWATFKQIHDFVNNVASPTQADRFYILRRFG